MGENVRQAICRVEDCAWVDQVAQKVIEIFSSRTGQIWADVASFTKQRMAFCARVLKKQPPGERVTLFDIAGSHFLFLVCDLAGFVQLLGVGGP